MSTRWSDEGNWLSVETTEAIWTSHHNFKMTCAEIYDYKKEENDIIEKVKSTLKYKLDQKFIYLALKRPVSMLGNYGNPNHGVPTGESRSSGVFLEPRTSLVSNKWIHLFEIV
ncbi:hypothetical protein AVEN_87967-1 [Araneus ventricosus]|uniref:Uncharacterized protein n=1 Tax=Araneus ventricosus TaxID=182803 RepID=A0A4Y2I4F7_ARAVE|nr:hypothetical protein AVEN_87967-1 [Araneus ventricosus]